MNPFVWRYRLTATARTFLIAANPFSCLVPQSKDYYYSSACNYTGSDAPLEVIFGSLELKSYWINYTIYPKT